MQLDAPMWKIKDQMDYVRELLWAYFNKWPPLTGLNKLMYSKVCKIHWDVRELIYKEDNNNART